MKNTNSGDKIVTDFTKNLLCVAVENHVPVWGDILAALNQTISDVTISDRFEPLERKLKNIKEEDLEKLKNLPVDDSLLIKDDLEKLINLYWKAAYKKRREYLANAILNVATLKNKDYQQNDFFIIILTIIPDISIEYFAKWRGTTGIYGKDFEKLQKKYKTEVERSEIIQNCVANGLLRKYDHEKINLMEKYNSFPKNISVPIDNDDLWEVTSLGYELKKFILTSE